jgi:predicted Fe-S protein YdhL (DUF1289 family)
MTISGPIQTPCINICEIDFDTLLCKGCGRTREEVARWMSFSDAERATIMAALPERMRKARMKAPGSQ